MDSPLKNFSIAELEQKIAELFTRMNGEAFTCSIKKLDFGHLRGATLHLEVWPDEAIPALRALEAKEKAEPPAE